MSGTRDLYSKCMNEQNIEGSGKASSYVRALDLLCPILKKGTSIFQDCSDIWNIRSVDRLTELYEYIIEQQNLGEKGIFGGEKPVSYWRDRYCSAALKSYIEFLILSSHEQSLWSVYNTPQVEAAELSKQLSKKKIRSIKYLLENQDIDFSSKE